MLGLPGLVTLWDSMEGSNLNPSKSCITSRNIKLYGPSAPNFFTLGEHTLNTQTTCQGKGKISIPFCVENESNCFTASIWMVEREIRTTCKTAVFTRAWSGAVVVLIIHITPISEAVGRTWLLESKIKTVRFKDLRFVVDLSVDSAHFGPSIQQMIVYNSRDRNCIYIAYLRD